MLGLYFKPSVWDFPVKTSLSVNKCYIVSNVQKKALKVKQFCDPKRILNHIFKCQTNTVISWNWLIVTMIKKQFIAMASKLLGLCNSLNEIYRAPGRVWEKKWKSEGFMSYSFMSVNVGKAENNRGRERRERKFLSSLSPSLSRTFSWVIVSTL